MNCSYHVLNTLHSPWQLFLFYLINNIIVTRSVLDFIINILKLYIFYGNKFDYITLIEINMHGNFIILIVISSFQEDLRQKFRKRWCQQNNSKEKKIRGL